MLHLGFRSHDAALLGSAEHLLEVQILALVGDVEHLVGGPVLHTLNDGSQVCGGVDGRAVGLHQDHGRQLLLVAFLGNGNNPGTVGQHSQATGLQVFHHGGDIGIGVAFAQPLFVVDIQGGVNPAQVGQGNAHDVIPDSPVAPAALLQLVGSHMGLLCKHGIRLLGRSGGVDLLQLGEGEGGLGGILAGIVGIEVGEFRLALLELSDDQTHLQTPVAQVNIADGLVAQVLVQPLQSLTNDGGTQVADVQGLCYVGSAVVDDGKLALTGLGNAKIGAGAHGFQVLLEECVGELQVNEAGHHGVNHSKISGIQLLCHSLGNLDGSALVLLGGSQRAVALIFAQVGPVGNGHTAKGCIVAGICESGLHLGGNNIKNSFHSYYPFCCCSHSR